MGRFEKYLPPETPKPDKKPYHTKENPKKQILESGDSHSKNLEDKITEQKETLEPEELDLISVIDNLDQVPLVFENPQEFSQYQSELQKKFQQLSEDVQKEIMNNLGNNLGEYYTQLESEFDPPNKKIIQEKIRKTRMLLQTFHLVFNQKL